LDVADKHLAKTARDFTVTGRVYEGKTFPPQRRGYRIAAAARRDGESGD